MDYSFTDLAGRLQGPDRAGVLAGIATRLTALRDLLDEKLTQGLSATEHENVTSQRRGVNAALLMIARLATIRSAT